MKKNTKKKVKKVKKAKKGVIKINPLLTTPSLQKFIEEVKITKDQKDYLLSELSGMGKEEKLRMLNLLEKIRLLDLEENKALAKINNNW